MTQLHFVRSFAILYQVHSILACDTLKANTSTDLGQNFRFDGYFSSVLRPVIWQSSLVNWGNTLTAFVNSSYKLRLFESVIEQSRRPGLSIFLQDVLEFCPLSMARTHAGTGSVSGGQSSSKTAIWHVQTGNRLTSYDIKTYTITAFQQTFCGSSHIDSHSKFPDAILWLAGLSCKRNRVLSDISKDFEYGDCPKPLPGSKPQSGSEHITYAAKIGFFHVVVRHPKRGRERLARAVDSLIHPSLAFRLGQCTSGSTDNRGVWEIYRTAHGVQMSQELASHAFDVAYNMALDITETFGYLHYGRPQGGLRHGDFSVGYFQNPKLPPEVMNMVVDYRREMTMLIDFDSSFRHQLPLYNWTLTSGMRQDIRGLGFVIWGFAGIRVTRDNIESGATFTMIHKCHLSLQGLCRVAAKCIDSNAYSSLDTATIFDEIVDSIPAKILRGKRKH